MKSIYDLELHERYVINQSTMVQRVPGGWNYIHCNGNYLAVQFVPYCDDFNPKYETKFNTKKAEDNG